MPWTSDLTSERLAGLCARDGEFRQAARHWTGGLRLEGASTIGFTASDGALTSALPAKGAAGVITLAAEPAIWAQLTAEIPARFENDIGFMLGRVQLDAAPALWPQYYPAVMRAIELLRGAEPVAAPPSAARPGTFDAPIGRYVHLELDGVDHRVYFEEAGQGVPLLLQHTAGAHGAQWRHLMDCAEITDHFRLIAYDLPFHGKSLPPVGPTWWAEEYRLTGAFLRQVPVKLAAALELDRPVFMGCSVGGLLALDLALRHPDVFSAVISVEGALRIGGDYAGLWAFSSPKVSNEYKARLMNALMSPTSPEAFRKETSQVYASGWPPAFLGDLWYYVAEYDLTADAAKIDTDRVSVDIFNGEYDLSGTMELGAAAHQAIKGSTWTAMPGVGHFPMSENPQVFIAHLMPALDRIRARRD